MSHNEMEKDWKYEPTLIDRVLFVGLPALFWMLIAFGVIALLVHYSA
jgi:hypothetical protein